jgi:hypothetical protein
MLEEDFYYNKEGLMVFTSKYLSERGYCCGNVCKHCPFNYVNVNEENFLKNARRTKSTR